MGKTGIEWVRGEDGSDGETWNPTTGCNIVSEGCRLCYAMTLAKRLKAMELARGTRDPKYQRDGDPRTSGPGFGLSMHPHVLATPMHWRKPRKVFVDSMSDLFHSEVTTDFITRVFAVMAATPQHTYLILTKRPGRMRSLLSSADFQPAVTRALLTMPELSRGRWPVPDGGVPWPLPNVWLGTSVETQKWADVRIPLLMQTPAAVRFLSCEPLLGPVNLHHGHTYCPDHDFAGGFCTGPCPSRRSPDWVIVGGESGHGARPMHPDWARSLRDQCQAASVPFLFKQWGEWAPNGYVGIGYNRLDHLFVGDPVDEHGCRTLVEKVGKKRAGRVLDGVVWDESPVASA
jgi:protein gp37